MPHRLIEMLRVVCFWRVEIGLVRVFVRAHRWRIDVRVESQLVQSATKVLLLAVKLIQLVVLVQLNAKLFVCGRCQAVYDLIYVIGFLVLIAHLLTICVHVDLSVCCLAQIQIGCVQYGRIQVRILIKLLHVVGYLLPV